MKTALSIALTSLALLPAAGFSQDISVQPGLWEHSLNLESESGRIELALEMARALPPAQRQWMEDMLTRQGIRIDLGSQSFRNCITEQEAFSGEFRFVEQGGCEETRVRHEGSTTHISFVCARGQGELVLEDGTHYTGQSSMNLDFNGLTEKATARHSGRWLGASCAALEQ